MEEKLAPMTEVLKKAYNKNYAVGAFNFSSIEVMRAILDAANNAKSPVILALSESGIKYASIPYLSRVIGAALEESSVPITLHLDHGKNFDIVKQVIDAGFNSVMIDGSHLPFDENVALTKKVCDYAHDRDIAVEGELGSLAGVEDDVSNEVGMYTDPEQAAEFVRLTGVDSLAIAIGTSHGAFKFKHEPRLRFDILDEITKLIPGLPIVLHGASSVPQYVIDKINQFGGTVEGAKGVPDDMIKRAIKTSVCKLNSDTDLRMCYTAAMREFLVKNPGEFTPRKYLQYAKDAVREMLEDRMKNLYNSAGKA